MPDHPRKASTDRSKREEKTLGIQSFLASEPKIKSSDTDSEQ